MHDAPDFILFFHKMKIETAIHASDCHFQY